MCRDYKQILRHEKRVTFYSQVSKMNALYIHRLDNSFASFVSFFFLHLVSAGRTAYLEPKSLPKVICAISRNLTNKADMLVNELLVIGNTTGHSYCLLLSYFVL